MSWENDIVCVWSSHLLHKAPWQPGWDSLVNLSSLVLTHGLTFVSIRRYLAQHWPRGEREMDKWMRRQAPSLSPIHRHTDTYCTCTHAYLVHSNAQFRQFTYLWNIPTSAGIHSKKKKEKEKKAGNSTDPWILRLLTHQNPPKTGTVCPNKLSQYFTTQKRGSQCQRALKNVIPLDCVLAWTCPAKTARYQMMSEVELGLKLPCQSSLHPWCAAGMVSIKWLKIEVFDNPPERLWR